MYRTFSFFLCVPLSREGMSTGSQPIKSFSVLTTYFYLLKKKYSNDAVLDIQCNIHPADVSSRGLTSAQEEQAVKAN